LISDIETEIFRLKKEKLPRRLVISVLGYEKDDQGNHRKSGCV